MAATGTLSSAQPAGAPSNPGANQPPVPPKIAALLTGLTALTGAVIGLITSFNAVRWTSAETTLVATEVAAFWALAGAVSAHLWPQTKKQPVAVAGTVTAFVSATLSLGIGFAWWQLTQSQNASLISLVTAIVAVAAALAARSTVTADTTPAAKAESGPQGPGAQPIDLCIGGVGLNARCRDGVRQRHRAGPRRDAVREVLGSPVRSLAQPATRNAPARFRWTDAAPRPVMKRQPGNRTTVARPTDTASHAKHAGSSNSVLSKEAPDGQV